PPQLDQKTIERTRLTMPTISRITPAAWMLRPETVASTAQIKTAPAAMRTRLIPTPMIRSHSLSPSTADVDPRLDRSPRRVVGEPRPKQFPHVERVALKRRGWAADVRGVKEEEIDDPVVLLIHQLEQHERAISSERRELHERVDRFGDELA